MDQPSSDGGELSFFDTSPGAFPWTNEQRKGVNSSRKQTGSLFFDDLIQIAQIDGSLYPPKDVLALRKLLAAIRASSFDRLKKDCLVYYLIRDTKHDDRAASFAQARLIPAQFVSLADGYWNMDNGNHELAVSLLSSISVKPDFTSKILATLAKMPVQAESARLVLHFIRFARPPIDSPEDVHVKLDALAQTSIREAWMYMRSFDEGEFRAGLIGRVFEYCLTPKPKPGPLQALLAFPFTPFEDQTLSSLCLSPPSLSAPSLNVLYDLANVRLVSQGRFAEAIKLDRAIGANGAAADKRRATILGLVRLLPEVQRRILELEMDDGGAGDDVMAVDETTKGKSQTKKAVNGHATDDVDMSIGQSSSRLPASTSNGSTSQMSVSSAGSNLHLPLSASQVLRTSSSQLAIHRAFIAPSSPAPAAPSRPTQTLHQSSSFGNGASSSTPGRPQPSSTAFSFQPPTNVSSPRPLAFGDLNKSLFASKPASPAPGTPKVAAAGPSFGRAQSPFAPAASTARPVEGSPAPNRQAFPQAQAASLASSQAARGGSPFAQQAQKASALQRSAAAAAAPRGAAGSKRLAFRGAESATGLAASKPPSKRRDEEEMEEPKRPRPSASSSSKAREQDVDMDEDDAEPSSRATRRQEEDLTVSQLDHRPRTTRKQPAAATSSSQSATTTTTKRKAATSTRKAAAEEGARSPSPPPIAAPAPKPTRSSHRRTASQVSNAAPPPPPAPAPAPTRASTRAAATKPAAAAAAAPARATRTTKPAASKSSAKALHIPGAFDSAPVADEEADEANDVVSSPPPKAAPTKRAAPGSSRPKTRATSVISDMGDEDETTGARTPPRRTTRGSVRGTVSPEAQTGPAKGVRRSTRRG